MERINFAEWNSRKLMSAIQPQEEIVVGAENEMKWHSGSGN